MLPLEGQYIAESHDQFYEASEECRATGWFIRIRTLGISADTRPACFLQKLDLPGLIRAEPDGEESQDQVTLGVLRRNGCDQWRLYRPGLSPKEHLAVRLVEELERNRREWEGRFEEDRRKWQQELEADRRTWETKLDSARHEDEQKFNQINAKIAVIGVLLGVVTLLAGLAALTPDSLLGRCFMNSTPESTNGEAQ